MGFISCLLLATDIISYVISYFFMYLLIYVSVMGPVCHDSYDNYGSQTCMSTNIQ